MDVDVDDHGFEEGWELVQPSLQPSAEENNSLQAEVLVHGILDLFADDSEEVDIGAESEVESDDGFVVPEKHVRLAEGVLATLKRAGIWGPKLMLQENELPELLSQTLSEMGVSADYAARGYILSEIDRELGRTQSREPLAKRARQTQFNPLLARTKDLIEAAQIEAGLKELKLSQTAVIVPVRGKRPRKLGKLAGRSDAERQHEEEEELQRLQVKLVEWLIEAEVPCTLQAKLTQDPVRALMGTFGKTRLNTAKKYMKYWAEFRSWLITVHSVTWPRNVGQLLDYLFMMQEEPCRPTVPGTWMQAVHWMFKRGDFTGVEDLSRDSLLKLNLEKVQSELVHQPIRQAARFPILVLASLEAYLRNTARPLYKRLQAGCLLFRTWGTLRFDDQQRIRRGTLRMMGGMAITELLATKTTGPGKRVRQLPVAVAEEAYLLEPGWLPGFMELVTFHLNSNKDYLMEIPSQDFGSGTGRRMRHSQSAALTRTVMSELTVPVYRDGGWKESEQLAVPRELVDLFSEHSPRCVLPSIAILIETDEAKRNCLGRWKPSGAEDYVRTYRTVVTSIQIRSAVAMRQGTAEVSKEWDVLDRAKRHLKEKKNVGEANVQTITDMWQRDLSDFIANLSRVQSVSEYVESFPVRSTLPAENAKVATISDSGVVRRPKVRRTMKYLVTYSRGGNLARLHRTDANCYWAGVEVKDCQVFDEVDPSMYSHRCKFCWPQLNSRVESDSSSSEDEDTSSEED